MRDLFKDIPNLEFRDDLVSKKIYSIDASIFEVDPLAIAIPKTQKALQECVQIACKNNIPIIPRGAATGVTGGCLGKGLIIDTSKYLHRILEINREEHYVTCEPGLVLDDLNTALKPHGFQFGPDTSTANRATVGGMVANNAAGTYSIRYGNTSKHILEADLILSNGERVTCGTEENSHYQKIVHIQKKHRKLIENAFPKISRRSSGYNLNALLNDPLNLASLIGGSEGSLGVITQLKLKIVPLFHLKGICIFPFDTLDKALNSITEVLSHSPAALELIDHHILAMGKQSPTMKSKLHWLKGDPQAILVAGFEKDPKLSTPFITDSKVIEHVWELRRAGLELLLSKRSYTRAVAFIEDIAVPPQNIAPFIFELKKILGTYAGIYGHVGDGCIHIRPFLNLSQDKEHMLDTMHQVLHLLRKYDGTLSGEHGDGLIRSWLNEKLFGKNLYRVFQEIKEAFDPLHLMNPNKIIASSFPDELRKQPQKEFKTFLDFSKEGGFSLSVDMCNGNGLCRKETSLMCPSYHATRDEYDTTRARAQSLRALINNEKISSDEIMDVLDLCVECKGCKKECPSQVDMAKIKAEMLFQHQEKQGYSLRSRLFANIATLFHLGSFAPRLFNLLTNLPFPGIALKRQLPKLANTKFSTWFSKQKTTTGKKVILFNDTFTEFSCPEIGKSAFTVLQNMGFQVLCPPWSCCGRPLISKGFLKQAKKKAEKLIHILYPYAKENIPIIGLEPSCILTLKDEFFSLLGQENEKALTVAKMCYTFDQFIDENYTLLSLKPQNKTFLVHGHCHQKALTGTTSLLNVLKRIPGATVEEIPSGCCGMAGSFGYEKEHYEISMKMGELSLFPAIRNADKNTVIIANGFSCRSQIPKPALHLALLLNHIKIEFLDQSF